METVFTRDVEAGISSSASTDKKASIRSLTLAVKKFVIYYNQKCKQKHESKKNDKRKKYKNKQTQNNED